MALASPKFFDVTAGAQHKTWRLRTGLCAPTPTSNPRRRLWRDFKPYSLSHWLWFEGPFEYQAWERTDVDMDEEDAEDEEAEEEVEPAAGEEEEEVSNTLSPVGTFLIF